MFCSFLFIEQVDWNLKSGKSDWILVLVNHAQGSPLSQVGKIQDDATLGLEVQVVGWEMDALPFQIGWGRFNIRLMTLEYFRIRNRCKQQFPSQNLVVFKVGSYIFEVRTCWVMKLGYSTFCLGLRRCQDVDVMNWDQVKQWRWTSEVVVPYLKLYLKPCPFKRVDQTQENISSYCIWL